MRITWGFIYLSVAALLFAFIWVFFGGPFMEWLFVGGLSMLLTSAMIKCAEDWREEQK